MSLVTGRIAITTYLRAQWPDATPLGMDGWAFEPASPSVQFTITEGAVFQGSIGRVTNVVYQVGLVTATIFTNGGSGSNAWRVIADIFMGLTHNKVLDAAGAVVTSGAQTPLIRFSPPELGNGAHPYVAADTDEVPFRRTNVIAPFCRYELR